MDVAAMLGILLAAGGAIVSVAVYASRTRADADATAHKVRNLDNWRENIVPATYARKDTIAAELSAIRDALARIERHQEDVAKRLMGGGV